MTTYFATYFNYNNCPVRKRLTQEFCNRYPWVTLLQAVYDGRRDITTEWTVGFPMVKGAIGFIDYTMINFYLSRAPDITNLVVIDADLILPDDFREKMDLALGSAEFVHGFEYASQILGTQVSDPVESFYKTGRGHTGYIYGFSKLFLDRIGRRFPDYFLAGGFDYVLGVMITKGSLAFTEKFIFRKRLEEFRKKLEGVTYTYLAGCNVLHNYHGPVANRLTPFEVYEDNYGDKWFRSHRST